VYKDHLFFQRGKGREKRKGSVFPSVANIKRLSLGSSTPREVSGTLRGCKSGRKKGKIGTQEERKEKGDGVIPPGGKKEIGSGGGPSDKPVSVTKKAHHKQRGEREGRRGNVEGKAGGGGLHPEGVVTMGAVR